MQNLFQRIHGADDENENFDAAFYNLQSPSQDQSKWLGNIAGNVAAISANVTQCGGIMQNYVATVERRLDEATRKKRRAVTRRDIVVDAQGVIRIGEYYDDGSAGSFSTLMTNVRGEWCVYRLNFTKTEVVGEWFGIAFPQTGHFVIGKCGNLKKSTLYEYFVRSNVKFNAKIKESHIENALFNKFLPLINDCGNVWTFPELAGWNGGKFLDKTTVNFAMRRDFPKLPIVEKSFRRVEDPGRKCGPYFEAAKNIRRWQDKMFVLTAPIAGVLSSVFAEEGVKISQCLNFVLLDTTQKARLVVMLQIFDRDISQVILADANDKKIESELSKANDELIIIDSVVRESDKPYIKQKKRENTARIFRQMLERNDTSFGIKREIHAVPVFINSDRMLDRGVKNIFLDRGFWGKELSGSEALGESFEAFLTLFVDYTERFQEEIRSIIRRFKASNKEWVMLWEIYEYFWEAHQIDIKRLLNIPEDIDWAGLLNEKNDSDELKKMFVHGLRLHIGNFRLVFKKRGQPFVNDAVFYDDEHVYFSRYVLNRAIYMCGLTAYKYNLLCQLRESGDLVTDVEGLTRRPQIGGKRVEMYQFRRKLFNVLGEPDIVDLGGIQE